MTILIIMLQLLVLGLRFRRIHTRKFGSSMSYRYYIYVGVHIRCLLFSSYEWCSICSK